MPFVPVLVLQVLRGLQREHGELLFRQAKSISIQDLTLIILNDKLKN